MTNPLEQVRALAKAREKATPFEWKRLLNIVYANTDPEDPDVKWPIAYCKNDAAEDHELEADAAFITLAANTDLSPILKDLEELEHLREIFQAMYDQGMFHGDADEPNIVQSFYLGPAAMKNKPGLECAQQVQVEWLRREAEQCSQVVLEDAVAEEFVNLIDWQQAQLKAQAKRIEALENALKPFAESAVRHWTQDNGGGNRQMTLVFHGKGKSPLECRNEAVAILQQTGGADE